MTLYQRYSNPSACMNKMAARAKKKKRKTFKLLPLLNQLMDFEMISQECSLGDPQCHVFIVMTLCTDFMFVCLSTIIKSCRRNSFLCFTAFFTCIHLSMASLPLCHSSLGMLHCLVNMIFMNLSQNVTFDHF